MEGKQDRDFLIRNIPAKIFNLLEKSAKEHQRSKNQEAILILTTGLSKKTPHLSEPKPFKWKKKMSSRFIKKAIDEGRE